ncbi:uncharacterized protein LOC132476650 [Mesoplodon densirostris]|uniref:uncharacterized protein LOC132476650 n=1 Tax=Mesoplodon densirostris TaxID=48708 RepID=UPI0028DB8E1B|nr:uncharacterized protein LOC132476650 [Mesoplodon densirostris]
MGAPPRGEGASEEVSSAPPPPTGPAPRPPPLPRPRARSGFSSHLVPFPFLRGPAPGALLPPPCPRPARPISPPGPLPAPAHLPSGRGRRRLPSPAGPQQRQWRRQLQLQPRDPPPPPRPNRRGPEGGAVPPPAPDPHVRAHSPPGREPRRGPGPRWRRRGLRPGCHSAILSVSPASRARGPSGGSGEDTWWEEGGSGRELRVLGGEGRSAADVSGPRRRRGTASAPAPDPPPGVASGRSAPRAPLG